MEYLSKFLSRIGNFWPGFIAFLCLLAALVLLQHEVIGSTLGVSLMLGFMGVIIIFGVRASHEALDGRDFNGPR